MLVDAILRRHRDCIIGEKTVSLFHSPCVIRFTIAAHEFPENQYINDVHHTYAVYVCVSILWDTRILTNTSAQPHRNSPKWIVQAARRRQTVYSLWTVHRGPCVTHSNMVQSLGQRNVLVCDIVANARLQYQKSRRIRNGLNHHFGSSFFSSQNKFHSVSGSDFEKCCRSTTSFIDGIIQTYGGLGPPLRGKEGGRKKQRKRMKPVCVWQMMGTFTLCCVGLIAFRVTHSTAPPSLTITLKIDECERCGKRTLSSHAVKHKDTHTDTCLHTARPDSIEIDGETMPAIINVIIFHAYRRWATWCVNGSCCKC